MVFCLQGHRWSCRPPSPEAGLVFGAFILSSGRSVQVVLTPSAARTPRSRGRRLQLVSGSHRGSLFPSMLCCGAHNLWFLCSKVELFVSKQKPDVWIFILVYLQTKNTFSVSFFPFFNCCFLKKCTSTACSHVDVSSELLLFCRSNVCGGHLETTYFKFLLIKQNSELIITSFYDQNYRFCCFSPQQSSNKN